MGRVTKVPKTKVTMVTKVTSTEETKTKETKVTMVTKVTKTKVTKVTSTEEIKTKVLVANVLVGVIRGRIPVGANTTHPRGGGGNPSSHSSGQNQGTHDYDVDTSDMSNLPDSVSVISHADTISTLIQDEYLHDPTNLPSNHLNVTVSVQDKDKERQPSVRRMVGKAVLDTANYSEDFISFSMIQKLNAMHICYGAPKAPPKAPKSCTYT